MKRMLLLIASFIFLSGCLYAVRYDATYKGRIIDADTGQPIEGVVVLGVWYKGYYGTAGIVHKYYDAKETVTDKNGEFEISGVGLRVMSNVEPMEVLIFKAGYEYIGMGPWEAFKGDITFKEKIKWEGDKAIIPLRKLTMEERRRNRPGVPPTDAPLKKIRRMLMEINKNEIELGAEPYDIWGGEKVYEKNNIR